MGSFYKRRGELDANNPTDGRSTGVFQAPEKKKTPTGLDMPSVQGMAGEVIEGKSESPHVEVVEKTVEVPVPYPVSALDDPEHPITWFGSFGVSAVGLYVGNEVSPTEWWAFLQGIKRIDTAINLVIGDCLAYGDRVWGVTYERVAALIDRDVQTLRDYAWVCGAVDISLRKDVLTMNHYKVVANLPHEQQRQWLEKAVMGDDGKHPWSYRRLEAEIKGMVLPQIATDKRDPLSRFRRAFAPFEQKMMIMAIKARAQQRTQMAAYLRQLADKIENSDTTTPPGLG